jgi:hypothetical protein
LQYYLLKIDKEMGFSACLEEKTLPAKSGDILLLYFDGITEAMNANNHLFDLSRLESGGLRFLVDSRSIRTGFR